ncbi:MAG: membrane dipeptidase [Clostridia bacterium]|nr:membrane dipeptidase [Clostridia bacterium]
MNKFLVSDSHTDILTSFGIKKKNKKDNSYFQTNDYQEIKDKVCTFLTNQNLDIISLAVFTYNKNITLRDLELFKNIVDEINERKIAKTLFGVEDIGFVKNFYDLQDLVKLKPFSCTLTWNNDNKFCGGAYGKSNLTEFGKFTINYLEKCGILIDTAHMNRKSFWEFVDLTTKPIFNSHSNIFSLHKHKRNLLDKQIKKIVDTNGYVGITLYDKFVKSRPINSYDIAVQFNYLVEKFGINNFGFGTDFFGIDEKNLPTDISSYNDLYKVADHLLSFGYTAQNIEKLMTKNFSDFVYRVRD